MNEGTKILYVDDEPINTKLFEINFKNKFLVLTAETGTEGLEVLKANPDVNVILSDMKMPGMNGLEFIEIARGKYPDKKFFILTGFEVTVEIQKAIDKGLIVKYFQKPLKMSEVELSIKEILE